MSKTACPFWNEMIAAHTEYLHLLSLYMETGCWEALVLSHHALVIYWACRARWQDERLAAIERAQQAVAAA